MLTLFIFKLKYYFQRTVSFLRSNGHIIAIILGIMIAYIVFRKTTKTEMLTSMWKLVDREKTLHREYVEKSKRIHSQEVKNIETAGARAIEAIRQAEITAEIKNEKLDEDKKTRIKEIVNKHAAHPELAAKELAEKFGFIYAP